MKFYDFPPSSPVSSPKPDRARSNDHHQRMGWIVAVAGLSVAIWLFALPCFAQPTTNSRLFDGPFFGLDLGSQNYFGGAVVGEVDLLTRDSKAVVDLSVGYRKQFFRNRLWFGLRVNYGRTDGDLQHTDPSGFRVFYENDAQIGYGGEFGWTVGRRRSMTLFLYGYETERDFQVTIATPSGRFRQSDEQGVFRYGLGIEVGLRGGLHLRGTAGTNRADFGDQLVSQDPDGRLDFGIGLVYQLGRRGR